MIVARRLGEMHYDVGIASGYNFESWLKHAVEISREVEIQYTITPEEIRADFGPAYIEGDLGLMEVLVCVGNAYGGGQSEIRVDRARKAIWIGYSFGVKGTKKDGHGWINIYNENGKVIFKNELVMPDLRGFKRIIPIGYVALELEEMISEQHQ